MVADDPVDIVIVGAGAAGSIYADVLARAGRSVRVLERGRAWELSDLVSNQIWARRLKWGGPPPLFRGDRPGFSHNLQTGQGLGGAALHHYATWPRLHESAFATRTRFGFGRDWPFSYEELAPWYDALEAEAGISGDAAAEVWRPPGKPYPMPPLPLGAQGQLLARGFKALGLPVAPLPVAINSTEYRDRPACQNDGWCDAGCPIQALWNPLVLNQPRARGAGARFTTGAVATRIRAAARERAAGVEYRQGGTARFQPARVVVLAASLIQNPRLLLASRGPLWPDGAGNAQDQVGRHLMMEGLTLVYGLFDEPTEPHRGVSAGQLLNRSRGVEDRPDAPPGAYQWQIAPAAKPNDMFGVAMTRSDIHGPALHAFMRQAARGLASMACMVEQPAEAENRVTLSDQADADGLPMPLVFHRRGEALERLQAHTRAEGLAVMRAAGAREAWAAPFQTGHLAGGTIMGGDPATSACDAHGRLHGVPNIVLSGSGLFPANGGVSPTFTLSALALRSATDIARNWSAYV